MDKKILDTIRDLKEEYEHIPVPPQAKNRVLAGIAQGKRERRRQSGLRVLRRGAASCAAAAACMIILVNVSPTVASAMENIPVIGSIARVVTRDTYKDQTNHFEADIQIPKVEGEEGSESPAVNLSIEEYAQSLIRMYEQELSESQGEWNYSLSSSYEVVTDNDKYLSLRINTTLVMASGTEFVKIFTVDKSTGEVVSLAQLLGNDPARLEAVSDNIKSQMIAQMAADDSISYFYQTDYPETDFKGLTGEESFYFDSQGQLVITFDEYTVAPGYMGAVEFTIPLDVTGKL